MADAAAKEAAENQAGTLTIDPRDNRTMYALTADVQDGDSLRTFVGEGAVESYVAEKSGTASGS
eukprot:gene23832-28901_t